MTTDPKSLVATYTVDAVDNVITIASAPKCACGKGDALPFVFHDSGSRTEAAMFTLEHCRVVFEPKFAWRVLWGFLLALIGVRR